MTSRYGSHITAFAEFIRSSGFPSGNVKQQISLCVTFAPWEGLLELLKPEQFTYNGRTLRQ